MPQAIAGVVVSGLGLTAGSTGALLVTSAVQLGVGLALSALTANLLAPDSPEAPDGRVLFSDPIGPRVKRYGTQIIAGQVVFGRAGGAGSLPSDIVSELVETGRYLHRIIVHGHGNFAEILEYRLDGVRRVVETDGRVFSEAFSHGNNGSLLRIESRLGEASSTYYPGVVDAASEWTPAHRLAGLCTTWIRCEQRDGADHQRSYPNGATKLEVLANTSPVFDPRSSTRQFNDNAALVINDWIESDDGFGLAGWMYQPDLIAAANKSDVLRPLLSGGSSKRWRLAASCSMAGAPIDPLRQMLVACGGDLRFRPDGLLSLNVGGDPDPVITLTEDHFLELLESDDGTDALERFTTAPARYVDEQLDHAPTTMEPWINEAELERIGFEETGPELDLTFAPNHAQARHAAKVASARANPAQRVKIRWSHKALPAMSERTINVDLPRLGVEGVFRVVPFTLNLSDMSLTLELHKITGRPQDWSVTEEGAAIVLPPEAPDEDRPPSRARDVQAYGAPVSGGPGIVIATEEPTDEDVGHYFAHSLAGANTWTVVTADTDATLVSISGLVEGTLYDVAVMAARDPATDPAAAGVTSVIIENVTATNTSPVASAPPVPNITDGGPGTAVIEVTAPQEVFLRRVEVLLDGVVVVDVRAAPGAEIQVAYLTGTGTHSFKARGVAIDGTLGAETDTITKTIS